MPRTTELKSEEAAVSSPLRRSCRIVAVNSPHPIKGRRLSATSDNNGADEKNENKPSRSRRAASVTKEDTEPKIEPAKPRTRRSSAAAEPAVVEEGKREPVTRSRRLSAAEEPSQEPLKPVKTRRSSITDDAAKTPAGAKSTEGDGKSKTVTRRRSVSKEPSDEAEETKPATRSRRKSMDKDVDVEMLEKKTTRQRRASTEKLEESETRVAKLTPIKNKRRPSVTENAVVLEPIEEVETERKSLSPPPVNDTSSKPNAASVKRNQEPGKADLNLSIINECSFTEGNSSHTEEAISTSEMSTGPLEESDQMESETTKGKEEIEENFALSVDLTTPPKGAKNVGENSTSSKKSPRFRPSTDSETATDDIIIKAQNNTEDPKISRELPEDVKMETSSDAILDQSQTSEKTTPEKMSEPAMDVETSKPLDKPKQISPETTISPRKSPRILARKENSSDQSELRTLDSNSTTENLKETKTNTSPTEKIKSPTPDKETPKSLPQNIVDPKDSDLKGSPQKELNVEDDSAILSKASKCEESPIKESATHSSTGSDEPFRFSGVNSSPEEAEEDDVLNVSKISNSSDKENIAVNIDNDSIKSKAPHTVEKRVLGDLSALNEKLTDLKQTTTVARVSNVFRPKNLEFSFVEPMDVDKTSVDLELTTSEKFDRTKLLSGATDDSIDESFKLNLSMTPVESPIINNVFETPKKGINTPKKVIDTPKKAIDTPNKVSEINKDMLDASSEKVISESNTVESDELIVDVSEASCATLLVESEDVSNIPISKEPIVEMKEKSLEQLIPDTTNNLNMSTISEEAVNKSDEQNDSKIVEDQSGDEKTMSPDYDFQLPSDESSSEVDNKFFERPSSPSRDESRASKVETENIELLDADKELKLSDEEICAKLPVEQLEKSSTITKLIESEEINNVEKENAAMEETVKTIDQASIVTENEENIVETDESEIVINEEPDETSEKPSSLEKSVSEEKEKDIEQIQEKGTVIDEIKIEYTEEKKESIPECDKSTINNSIVEKKEINDMPNVSLEKISENENHTKTDSEEISNDIKCQIDDQDKYTIEEKEEAFETKSDDLKTEEISDNNSPPKMENMKTSTEVQTEKSLESVKIPSGIELFKTSYECASTEVPTEANDDSSQLTLNTIVDNEKGSNVDAESEIVKIDSPSNKDYDYEEMERSFQDIVKDDEVKHEEKSESPISQPTSETKKSKKARKSKGKELDDKSDINEKLVKQHTVGTDSPKKVKKDNLLDKPESSTEDRMLESASSRTPKKANNDTKNEATADKTVEKVAGTEGNALSIVDNTIDNENVESNLKESEINIDTKSTKDSFTKTPKKTKKRAKVITLTESVPTEGPTSGEMESTDHFSKTNEKTKRTKMSGNHEDDKNVEGAEEPKTKKRKNKKSKPQNSKNAREQSLEKHPLEGFCHPKLDEIIDKMVLDTKRKKEIVTEEKDSSENEYASEEEEEESRVENPYIDSMAEEGEEDTPSEGSNDIIDDGESINTTESERETEDDYDDKDSFICDEEVISLLSGDDEDDLGDEKPKEKRKSRIINVEECNSDIIRIEKKKKPEGPKRRSRVISVSSSSGDENDELPKEDEQVLEHEPSVESEDTESSERPRKRKSSITIIENINVNDIKDTVLSQRIHHLVDSFCTTIPRQGDISMNLSLEYADVDEEPSTKTNNQKTPRKSLLSSPKETKTKKLRDAKKRGSSGDETVVPTKKQKLSSSFNDVEDMQDTREESNKRKRLSKSSEDINIKKSKKKKPLRKNREGEEDSEVSKKKRTYSEDDLRSKTFSLINQLITDVKNRPKRTFKPSTSKVDPSIDDSWDVEVEVADVKPSTSIVTKTEIEKYKFNKVHPSDFRNQMLYGSNRVKRIETKTLLKKKGAYF